MGVIFAFSAVPFSGEGTEKVFGSLNFYVRKLAHVSEYAILCLLCWRTWRPARQALALGAFTSFLYAVTDEWHQSLVAGREARVSDVAIDSIGIALTVMVVVVLGRTQSSGLR